VKVSEPTVSEFRHAVLRVASLIVWSRGNEPATAKTLGHDSVRSIHVFEDQHFWVCLSSLLCIVFGGA
jgi:hypothetical protein